MSESTEIKWLRLAIQCAVDAGWKIMWANGSDEPLDNPDQLTVDGAVKYMSEIDEGTVHFHNVAGAFSWMSFVRGNDPCEVLHDHTTNLLTALEKYYLVDERLEHLRGQITAERISYGEIAELQSLAQYIKDDDTLLLGWAGVDEGSRE